MLWTKSTKVDLGDGREITIGTGKIAQLANGSCIVSMGETQLLVNACSGAAREGTDFFPLQVDYREKFSAVGKFPGGYIKREGRPSDKEILTCRMTDRPIRPLFPKDFFDQVQVEALLLSADGENDSDVLCMLGASAALVLSDLPFAGPIGALRVGRVDGQFIANPTIEQRAKSELDLVYAGLADKVIMIEGEAKECSEQVLTEAMQFANEIVKKQIEAQIQLGKEAGREKIDPTLKPVPEDLKAAIVAACGDRIEPACLICGKEDRQNALNALVAEIKEPIAAQFAEALGEDFGFYFNRAFDHLAQSTIRQAILNKGYRPDGRGVNDLRPISAEVSLLPRVHGSGLFSRGETQALVITTLGSGSDTQIRDVISGGEGTKKFYLHYNFPNYSVGEVGRIMGPGRREIGHGNLAERSLAQVIPEDYPYTIRCVSEVMASNGSTSMASVCGGSLSLMDAGVPIKAAVAGISCGLVSEGDKNLLLSDILGAEDHFGDMDFKVCGTRSGITGFQLDLKIAGISIELLSQAMQVNYEKRLAILDIMDQAIAEPRAEISKNAPKIETVRIKPDKIGALIGPGGKNIKAIVEATGADINIEDDGTVNIFATNSEMMDKVKLAIEAIAAEVEIGKIYRGKVVTVKDFGAFVEILPGQEGLLHISEMANYRVQKVTDICNEGDSVTVKVLDIDDMGRIRLSRKAALEEMES